MKLDAKGIALNLLARREHSQEELRRKLLSKGFAREDIDSVLSQLSEAGWQNNRRFTEAYVRMRIARGYGPLRIQTELRERGIAADLIADCLQIYVQDWQHILRDVWQKKFNGQVPCDIKNRAKQLRFLQHRGFALADIAQFLQSIRDL